MFGQRAARGHEHMFLLDFGWRRREIRSPACIPRPRGVSRSEWKSRIHSNRVRTYVRLRTGRTAARDGPPESRTRISELKRLVRYRYASGPMASIEAGPRPLA